MIPSLHCQSAAMAGRQGIFLLWASRSRWRCFLPLFLRQGKHRVLRGRQEASLGHFRRQTRTAGIIACRRGRYSISLWYEDSSSSTLVCLLLLGSSTEFLVCSICTQRACSALYYGCSSTVLPIQAGTSSIRTSDMQRPVCTTTSTTVRYAGSQLLPTLPWSVLLVVYHCNIKDRYIWPSC
jgi:hypothetical protein